MDLRGYGASDKTPRGYDPPTTAFDITGVIAAWDSRSGGPRRPRLGRDGRLVHRRVRAGSGPGPGQRRRAASARLPVAKQSLLRWRSSSCRCSPNAGSWPTTAAFIEELLRSRAADGAGLFIAEEARHYRDALMLWPSPHCALEYQRMFVRDQFRARRPRPPPGACQRRRPCAAAVRARPAGPAGPGGRDGRGGTLDRRPARPGQPGRGRPSAARGGTGRVHRRPAALARRPGPSGGVSSRASGHHPGACAWPKVLT